MSPSSGRWNVIIMHVNEFLCKLSEWDEGGDNVMKGSDFIKFCYLKTCLGHVAQITLKVN